MKEGAEGEEAGADGREISLCGDGGGVFFVVFIVVVLVFGVRGRRIGAIVIVTTEIACAAFVEGPLRGSTLFVGSVLLLGFIAAERRG